MAALVAVMIVVTVLRASSQDLVGAKFYRALMAWLIFFVFAEGTIYYGVFKSILLAPPTAVIHRAMFYLEKGYLQINIASTMYRFISGFFIALLLGAPLGLLFGVYDKAYEWIAPASNFLRMTPPPAILPFAIIVFGIGEAPAVFVITVGCFFPIFLATMRGVREVETIHKEVVQTMGGDQMDVLKHVILPSALPSAMTGVRIGFGIGWLVLVASEIVAADSGLGFMIQGGRMRLDTPTVFVGMTTICILGLTMDIFLKQLEKYVTVRKKGGGEYIYF
ncbi:hypothetical protein MNBD_NITROSPINAE03-1674 [hydrothermal vent metagenome]|uniref:ABC transmembrane type-1 domain-containing protein n=1 Tax=hydrothermal vent metagenome TaxID=652676 RepID=A0A3B1C2Z4_9ZZZZ